jgi:aminoglycoside phosphotransferase (APT) family kinase protein
VPEVEAEVGEALVRALLATGPERLRHLSTGRVQHVATGWDNAVWRAGESYAVRVPVRAQAAPLLENEAAWTEEASAPLRASGVRVPRPVHRGFAPKLHPWPWLVVEWVPGEPVGRMSLAERGVVADTLADILPALHRPAPPEAPASPARGTPLSARHTLTLQAADRARPNVGDRAVAALLALVDEARAAPGWPWAPAWCHGDLHDDNIVLDAATEPAAVGLIDFGDLTRGDPAVDLRVLWTTFEATHREGAVRRLEASGAYDEAVWQRARGWAAAFVLAVAGDDRGRTELAGTLHHARSQLECP